jgi:hypothetical protein
VKDGAVMLLDTAGSAPCSARIDDAGQVIASEARDDLLQRTDPFVAARQVGPAVDTDPVGNLSGANFLNADDVVAASGGQHCRHEVLRELLARDDDCACP